MLVDLSAKIPSSEITPQAVYMRRREFLGAIAAVAGLGDKLSLVGRRATTEDSPTPQQVVTSYCNFYEFGSEKGDPVRYASSFKPKPWSVVVEGLCQKSGTYTLDDFLRPHTVEERIYRMRCVEGWSMVIPWDGFPLGDSLKRFEPLSTAKYVEFTSVYRPQEMAGQRSLFPRLLPWPYKEGLRMDEAMHPLAMLAIGLYGETLSNQNGAPIRLVVPWKYGFKSIKSIVKIRFVEKQPLNTWQQANASYYGFYANVNPDVSTPSYSQATERRIGEFIKRRTLLFNGYGDEVAHLYAGMDLRKQY
jgi:sulfoxide reductase catalytic subunit YedY